MAVMLLAAAECRRGIAQRFADLIGDPRNPLFSTRSVVDILRARILLIACGYEDDDDLDHLRTDLGSKLASGRLADTGRDLCSQPTKSRCENGPPQPFHSLCERNLGLPAQPARDDPPKLRYGRDLLCQLREPATRVRIAFAAACPEAALFRGRARPAGQ